ncbi:uncharacterized protein LY89DRAFT_725999 [Mollisia scopiformis]|uniref:DUF6594 domain-containing protein n=1 Tax=Mollisia scopiformis TaxID=149040 RepID=A0A132B5J6_MOLSC|nr:uncharacterized protein LY89DRAFT_725999 [Mollisia scopiformis]KUJ07164.1 hypothetical protein LY89DRAFT_725999 [Mollisia scopiformis]
MAAVTTPDRADRLESSGFSSHRYLSLAMTMDKDEGTAIFRRFGDLNMLNLLSLQAELMKLRNDLQESCVQNATEAEDYARGYLNAYSLPSRANEEETEASIEKKEKEKLQLLISIRNKLREYNSALLEAAQIRNLEPPDKDDIEYLRAWLRPEFRGKDLKDSDRACWDPENNDDLVSIKSQLEKGNKIITNFKFAVQIIQYKLWGYRKMTSNQANSNVIHFGKEEGRLSRTKIERKTAFVSRLVMALFGGIALIVPTIIMAKHQDLNFSLGTTSIATLLFAIILAFGARDSTGKDVLAATAAYAAVLVVFIGTGLASTTTTSTISGAGITSASSTSAQATT